MLLFDRLTWRALLNGKPYSGNNTFDGDPEDPESRNVAPRLLKTKKLTSKMTLVEKHSQNIDAPCCAFVRVWARATMKASGATTDKESKCDK